MQSFGYLEAAIMDQIWSAGRPLLVREVHRELGSERAYNTVLTVTEILFRKGWLTRERDGRAYRYQATISRDEYAAGLMSEALAASADSATALLHFARQIDPADAEELRQALEQARQAGDRP